MTEDLIELPNLVELKEMLASAKSDIEEVEIEDSDLLKTSKLATQVISILEEKIGKEKDLNKLNPKQKIEFAAYLSFLQNLLEEFFYAIDEDEFDEDFEEDEEEFEEDEE